MDNFNLEFDSEHLLSAKEAYSISQRNSREVKYMIEVMKAIRDSAERGKRSTSLKNFSIGLIDREEANRVAWMKVISTLEGLGYTAELKRGGKGKNKTYTAFGMDVDDITLEVKW